MLSVGLCLSARLPTGLLVFFGFVSSFGSIDHRLQQFELLPCGAVQTVDFFDHIVGAGSYDTLAQLFPAFLGFGVIPFSALCFYFIFGVSFHCRVDLRYSSSVRLTTELAVLENASPTSCSSSRIALVRLS